MLCEIGGTVGDIEGLPFFEAIRQLGNDLPRHRAIYIHLTLLPFITGAGELKTKPTQHSVRAALVRSTGPPALPHRRQFRRRRRKLALFCNVGKRGDRGTRCRQYLCHYRNITTGFATGCSQLSASRPKGGRPCRWRPVHERIHPPRGDVTIAIVGKYTGLRTPIGRSSRALPVAGSPTGEVNLDWINQKVFERSDPLRFSRAQTAFWCRGLVSAAAKARSRRCSSRAGAGAVFRNLLRHAVAVIEAAEFVGIRTPTRPSSAAPHP